jgi:hypothetical protein
VHQLESNKSEFFTLKKQMFDQHRSIKKVIVQLFAKSFLVSLFVLSTGIAVRSQILEIGGTVGGSYYLGDLNPGLHFSNTRVMYGIVTRYNLDTRWSLKLGAVFADVTGSTSGTVYLPERGLSFESKITDISGVVEFNFLPYFTGSTRSTAATYIYGGIGVFFFNPMSGGVALQPLGTEGQNSGYQGRSPYATTSISLPFGLGGKFSLTSKLSLQVYWEIHKTFTDYLDDISTTYYLVGRDIKGDDLAALMSDPTLNHTPGMQRGNVGTKDWYAVFGVALTYKFNLFAKNRCKEMEN